MTGSEIGWVAALHDDDRQLAGDSWLIAIATGRPFGAEFRVTTPDGQWRWCRARAIPIRDAPDALGKPGRIAEWIGVVVDVDARRRAEAHRALLACEIDHRSKNLLAVVQAVVRMTGDASLSAVGDRIAALARAHDLLSMAEWRGASLRQIAARELAPYREPDGRSRASSGATLPKAVPERNRIVAQLLRRGPLDTFARRSYSPPPVAGGCSSVG